MRTDIVPVIVLLLVSFAVPQTSVPDGRDQPTLKRKGGQQIGAWTSAQIQSNREREIAQQSHKTGLDSSYVRALLDAEGFSGIPFHVQLIDVLTLKARKQVLLVGSTVGTPRCIGVHVLDDSAKPKRVWAAFEVSGRQNFCSAAVTAHPPTAYATKDGVILVKIPVRVPHRRGSVSGQQKSELLVAEFVWSGATYTLSGVHRHTTYRWTGERWEEHSADS